MTEQLSFKIGQCSNSPLWYVNDSNGNRIATTETKYQAIAVIQACLVIIELYDLQKKEADDEK